MTNQVTAAVSLSDAPPHQTSPTCQVLDLSRNGLTGALTASWSALFRLKVMISGLADLARGRTRLLCMADIQLTAAFRWHHDGSFTTHLYTHAVPLTVRHACLSQHLNLSSNGLSGGLPQDYSALSALTALDTSRNPLLAGSLPPSWSALASLRVLASSYNIHDSPLPDAWSSLAALQRLQLAGNALSGALPATWGGGLTSLTHLDLTDNQMTGAVPPDWLAGMRSLQELLIGANRLRGGLPSLGTGPGIPLRVLDASFNTLGPSPLPPATQPYLRRLALLDLTGNGLTGGLPAGWSTLTELTALYLGLNALGGPLPPGWSALGVARLPPQVRYLASPVSTRAGSTPTTALVGRDLRKTSRHFKLPCLLPACRSPLCGLVWWCCSCRTTG